MKKFKGQSLNIKKRIIGKITKEGKRIFNRKNYITVSDKPKIDSWGYAGLITTNSFNSKTYGKKPAIKFSNTSIFSELIENDVVMIDPSGEMTVVWEAESPHNSIFMTEHCNCHCLTCPQPPSNQDEEEQYNINLRILELVDPKSTEIIGITGGEPTLVGDRLLSMIKLCRDKLPHTSISLLTNGRMFSQFEFTKQLAEIKHPDLIFCVSLGADTDSEHDYIMGAKGSFSETISGLHNLALFKQKVEIRIVIHKLNYERLSQLADFIYKNFPFVMHITFMGMEITGFCLDNINTLWIDPCEYKDLLRKAVFQLDRQLMNVSVYNIPLCLLGKDLWSFARQSISTWKNIYVSICEDCFMKKNCCGLFSTSGEFQSKNISPISQY